MSKLRSEEIERYTKRESAIGRPDCFNMNLSQKVLNYVYFCVLYSYFYVYHVTVYYVYEYTKRKTTSKSGNLEILPSW